MHAEERGERKVSEGYFKAGNLVFDMGWDHITMLLYVYLHRRANKHGESWFGLARASSELKASRTTISKAIRALEKANIVQVMRGRKGKTNRYKLTSIPGKSSPKRGADPVPKGTATGTLQYGVGTPQYGVGTPQYCKDNPPKENSIKDCKEEESTTRGKPSGRPSFIQTKDKNNFTGDSQKANRPAATNTNEDSGLQIEQNISDPQKYILTPADHEELNQYVKDLAHIEQLSGISEDRVLQIVTPLFQWYQCAGGLSENIPNTRYDNTGRSTPSGNGNPFERMIDGISSKIRPLKNPAGYLFGAVKKEIQCCKTAVKEHRYQEKLAEEASEACLRYLQAFDDDPVDTQDLTPDNINLDMQENLIKRFARENYEHLELADVQEHSLNDIEMSLYCAACDRSKEWWARSGRSLEEFGNNSLRIPFYWMVATGLLNKELKELGLTHSDLIERTDEPSNANQQEGLQPVADEGLSDSEGKDGPRGSEEILRGTSREIEKRGGEPVFAEGQPGLNPEFNSPAMDFAEECQVCSSSGLPPPEPRSHEDALAILKKTNTGETNKKEALISAG